MQSIVSLKANSMKLVPSLVAHPSNATAAFHSTGETWGMRKRKIPGDRVITSAPVLLLLAGTSISIVSAGQSDAPPRGVAVYVRDFEMSVAPATAPDPPSAAYTNKPKEDLELRSRQVQDHFAATLVETLQKQGYSSSRKQALPQNGIPAGGRVRRTR